MLHLTRVMIQIFLFFIFCEINFNRWNSRKFAGDSRQFAGDSRHFAGDSRQFAGDSRHFDGDLRQLDGFFWRYSFWRLLETIWRGHKY